MRCEAVRLRGGRVAKVVRLSKRELEVLRLLCRGCTSDKELAAQMDIAPGTARSFVRAMLRGLRLSSRAGLVVFAWQHEGILRDGSTEWSDHGAGCDCGGSYCVSQRDLAAA